MRSKSKTDAKSARYSAAEDRLLKILNGSKKPLSTPTVAQRYYGRAVEPPYNGRQIVGALLRSLKAKAAHNGEAWSVLSSPRKGPHPIEWWVG